ncbi:hypothetical protein D3C72_1697350 [compost metagenome]
MSGEVSHGKGIGATLFKDHLIALKLQFLHQLRKRATRLDRRARRAYVTGEKDGGPCLSGLAHQSIQRAEQRLATPRLFRAVNKADLHVENQECVHGAFPYVLASESGAKKRPCPLLAGLWGSRTF